MGVKFLSEEWTKAVEGALNSNDAFKSAAGSQTAKVQQVITTPEGEKRVQVRPSLWLSDLQSKPWIPVENEQSTTHHAPNPELVRELMDELTGADA